LTQHRTEPLREVSVFYPDLNNSDIDEVLAALKDAGATIIHTTLAWSAAEPANGEFDFSAFRANYERLRSEGFKFIIALDSSGRPVVPRSRVVVAEGLKTARPPWLAGVLSFDIFGADADGRAYAELDYNDASHLPYLHRFYEQALGFIRETLGDAVFGLVTGINSELEIKYGQLRFRWRSYSPPAKAAFSDWLAAHGLDPAAPMPQAEFNNELTASVPQIVPHFAEWMRFREDSIIAYVTPLSRLIRDAGYRTIGYFGQFFTFHDAIYAAGVVERCVDIFDIVSFDYNYFDGYKTARDPWIVPALVSFGRSLGYRAIKLGLYVERYRDFQTNKLDVTILQTLRDTLERIDEGDDLVSIEIGGVEASDLAVLRSTGLSSHRGRAFEVSGDLPSPDSDAIRVGVVASFDSHYLWHGDFSNNRDLLNDALTDSYRVFRKSRRFKPSVISARALAAGRYSRADFDLIFFPHTLVMDDALIGKIGALVAGGLLIAQDIGAGAFTPNGEARNLAALSVFGVGGAEWRAEPASFLRKGRPVVVGTAGETYFSHVRLAPAVGGAVLMPEVGVEGVGLVATTATALTFGFLPQIARGGAGPMFWETLFLETLEDFVRERLPAV